MSSCACGCGGICGCGSHEAAAAIGDPLAFRHSAILERLKDELSGVRVSGQAPLAGWTMRETSDPLVALLDAQAAALHVLAWNINRLWADGTLSMSEDTGAIGAIARLLGYVPRPALAASTVLSLDLDDIAAAPETVDLPKGLKVASVPPKDELPQVFETDAPLHASEVWNRLHVMRDRPDPVISTATTSITLDGTAPKVRAGDLVLVYAGGVPVKWLAARVVSFERPAPESPTGPVTTVLHLASQALVGCANSFTGGDFRNQVILLGDRASAFGSTAADLSLFSTQQLKDIEQMAANATVRPTDWKDLRMTMVAGTTSGGTLDLDAVHDHAMSGKAVLFTALGGTPASTMGEITAVQEGARKGFGLSGKVSRITVSGIDLTDTGFNLKVRETAILVETGRERLYVPENDVRVPDAATPARIVVQGQHALEAGRNVDFH